jgi:hypothetical protein
MVSFGDGATTRLATHASSRTAPMEREPTKSMGASCALGTSNNEPFSAPGCLID